MYCSVLFCFFFQAEDGIRDGHVTGVQTCALPIYRRIKASLGQVVAQSITKGHIDAFLGELLLKLEQELVDYAQDDVLAQRIKGNDGIQAVAELGGKGTLDFTHGITLRAGWGKANADLAISL